METLRPTLTFGALQLAALLFFAALLAAALGG